MEEALARPWAPVVMLALVAIAYVYAYVGHSHRPGAGVPGWWAWQDQAYYRSTAEALAVFSRDPSQYKVSLGYPLLGLPFTGIVPDHPFFVPNLIMVLALAGVFYRLGRLFLPRRDTVLMFLLVVVWTKSELIMSLVIPWTTIPTHLIAYLMIYLYLSRAPSWRLAITLTLLLGFAYLCRPGDGAFLSPIVAAAVLQLPGSTKRKATVAAAGLGLVLAFVLFDRVVNMAVFERALSTYERGVMDDFLGFGVAQRAYMLLFDAMPVFRTDEPMLARRMGYLVLVGPGLVFLGQRLRWKAVAPLASMVLGSLLYLSYDKFRPDSLFEFHIVHYVAWLFPLAGLAAYASFRRAWQRLRPRTYAAALGIPLAAFLFLRLEESPGRGAQVATDGSLVAYGERFKGSPAFDVTLAAPAGGRKLWLELEGPVGETTESDGIDIKHYGRPSLVWAFHAPHPADIGASLELRRLRWSLAPMPAWLERMAGRETVARPALPTWAQLGSWKKIQSETGRVDDARKALVARGEAGMLQHGAAKTLDHGRYVATWKGVVHAEGRVVLTIVDPSSGETLGRRVVDLVPDDDPLLGTVEFRVREARRRVEPSLYTFEGVKLDLHRFELWRYADWEQAHHAGG